VALVTLLSLPRLSRDGAMPTLVLRKGLDPPRSVDAHETRWRVERGDECPAKYSGVSQSTSSSTSLDNVDEEVVSVAGVEAAGCKDECLSRSGVLKDDDCG